MGPARIRHSAFAGQCDKVSKKRPWTRSSIPDSPRRWDCLWLGEVMLRLDPGESRIHTTRQFQVWEGGGEYNVARGLRRCFGLRTAIATALADNPVGRLVED